MRNLTILTLIVLSGCTSTETPTLSTASPEKALPAPIATPSPSPSPTVSASPSPSPSPSPSASPSPAPHSFQAGDGTISSPYSLRTAEDFQAIGEHAASYFNVDENISLQGVVITPIPTFSGVIYGNNKVISRMTITKTDGTTAAFTLNLTGTIVSLKFSDAKPTSNGYAAIVAGNVGATGFVSSGEAHGVVTSTLGGNGVNTGTGTMTFVTKSVGAKVHTYTEIGSMNGNSINRSVNF